MGNQMTEFVKHIRQLFRSIAATGLIWMTAFPILYAQQLKVERLKVDLLRYPDVRVTKGFLAAGAASDRNFHTCIANQRPVLSWELRGQPGTSQSAYRILVARHPDSLRAGIGNLWDSGKIASDESVHVQYNGKQLQPNTSYVWCVMVWDESDRPSPWSVTGNFHTADQLEDYRTAYYPLQKTDEIPVANDRRGVVSRFDFGRASFGQLRLTLETSLESDTVIVRMGEAVHPDGRLNTKPGGSIRFAAYQIPLHRGRHTYEVQHQPDKRNTGPMAIQLPAYIGTVLPFRYVEIEGKGLAPTTTDVIRSTVHYPFDEPASHFESSDTVLNAVWDLCKYSVKATSFAGIYVDGDRERIPYEADAHVNQLSHYYADGEYSMARRSLEHLIYHATWFTDCVLQTVPIAYNDYLHTGDIRAVRHHYDALKAKLLLPLREANGLISTRTGKQTDELKKAIHLMDKSLNDLVDWPHKGGFGGSVPGETDGFVFTTYNAVVNALHYKAICDMARLAAALGKTDDVRQLNRLAEETYRAFQTHLWDKKRQVFRDGPDTDHASLHTNMMAVAFGLVPESSVQQVMAFVRSRGMACGPYSTLFLMDAIYRTGHADYGLSLLASQDERSWYNMIRTGSTITMEAWDNKYKPNLDWNHGWGTVPASAIPGKLMGVEPLTPGWKTFRIRPQIGSLKWARVQVPTIRGTVHVACNQSESGYTLSFTIPGNTTADIEVPIHAKKLKQVTLNGVPAGIRAEKGWLRIPSVPSGEYTLAITYQ